MGYSASWRGSVRYASGEVYTFSVRGSSIPNDVAIGKMKCACPGVFICVGCIAGSLVFGLQVEHFAIRSAHLHGTAEKV